MEGPPSPPPPPPSLSSSVSVPFACSALPPPPGDVGLLCPAGEELEAGRPSGTLMILASHVSGGRATSTKPSSPLVVVAVFEGGLEGALEEEVEGEEDGQ